MLCKFPFEIQSLNTMEKIFMIVLTKPTQQINGAPLMIPRMLMDLSSQRESVQIGSCPGSKFT